MKEVHDWIWKHPTHYELYIFSHRPRKKKKKVKKPGVLTPAHPATFSDADAAESANSGTGGGSTSRPLPKRPSGRTNGAFVADA